MVECDEIIMNDHRGYLIDIEIERYCQCKQNTYDKPRHTILDNAKKSHVAKFNKRVEELMQELNLKQHVSDLKYISSREAFNVVDEMFTTIFNKARSYVEGPTRSIPFSQQKLEVSNQYLYWKLRVKQLRMKQINIERMKRRKELRKVKDNTTTVNQALKELKQAKEY